jgi:hypothetical protein
MGHQIACLCAAMALLAAVLAGAELKGQSRLSEPVFRVANEQPVATAAQPSTTQPGPRTEVRPAAATIEAPAAPFDLTQRPGEHPLMPLIRACKESLAHMDKSVRDYSCTLIKRERLDGELGEPQQIFMKVRHEPFNVYMSFIKPHAGREVLYPGKNENELIVREAGLVSLAGKMNLHPESSLAMRGQKYPITKVGMRNLMLEIIRIAEADTKFAESELTIDLKSEINKRPATLIQVIHPVPRQNFRAYVTRVFFDNELRVPIHYDAHLWPAKEGQPPPLDESFTYTNLKLNNGYTARDFDAENGEIFK